MNYKDILMKAGIKSVKSYKQLYKTKCNLFAKSTKTSTDSSWYCEVRSDASIVVNTKYYSYPQSVTDYNNKLVTD